MVLCSLIRNFAQNLCENGLHLGKERALCTRFAPSLQRNNILNVFDMSEKQKQVTEQREQMRTRSQSAESRRNSTKGQVEKERRGVLELLLQKNGLKRKELVDFLLGVWMAGKVDELTEQEKAQFPNLVF